MFHEPTMNNPHYNDCYFAYDEGLAESLYVFIEGNSIVNRFREMEKLTIAETGFGTGLNLIATIRALRDAELTNKTIQFYSVECYPLSVERIHELVARFKNEIEPEFSSFIAQWDTAYSTLQEGWNSILFSVETITIELQLFNGDVIQYLEELPVFPDAWFLDGHSPDKNPDMWNETVMGKVGAKSSEKTTLATFTAAGVVKEGLRKGGFFIKRKKGFGGKRHMITGKIETTSPEE